MNFLASIFRGNCENYYEFYDYIEITRTTYLRTSHDVLQESVFLKDSNIKQRKSNPFDYSINIIDVETVRRKDDYLTQTLNVTIGL